MTSETQTFLPMDLVRYVPYHAYGDSHHEDCQVGVVTSVRGPRGEAIFVLFRGSTAERCKADQLYLLARKGAAL